MIAGISYGLRPEQPYLGAFFLIVSGLFDILDGAVARVNHLTSKSGSFNDSTLDRLAEVAIYSGIIYAGYTAPIFALLALSFSLLVSYTRAKGDSLGVSLSGVGIGERAERLLVLIVFSIAGSVWIGVIIVLILAFITFLQRYITILRKLKLG
jgi:archaetidylinositol phosphate synthase